MTNDVGTVNNYNVYIAIIKPPSLFCLWDLHLSYLQPPLQPTSTR